MMFAGTPLAQVRSAPGALYVPSKSESPMALSLPAGAPSRAVVLDVPSSAERGAMTKGRAAPDKHAPLRIGFVRAVPEQDRRIPLASLPWQTLPDGGLAAQVTVTSATAAAVRVRLSLDGAAVGSEVRFSGTAGNRQVFAGDAGKLQRTEGNWSPVLEGETAIVEVGLPPATGMTGDLVLQDIGHMVVAGPALKRVQDIGLAESCEQDVVCASPSQALQNAANSVAQTVVVDGAYIDLCTGTLLNTTPQTNAPYLLTAYHCYDLLKTRTPQQVQAVADSMSTYWFFDASACGSNVAGPYVVTGGGATLLYLSQGLDVILFRLNAGPPSGAWFSGWDATPVVTATSAVVLHHPEGDLKKLSRGQTVGYTSFDGAGSYIELQYSTGSTEPGSSGSAMFTCGNSACTEYKVRGALTGGTAACSDPAGTDEYSRLDLAFPYIANHLAPGTVFPSGDNVGVEYYNVNLDHYFVTATAGEQNFVETGGAGPGWFRTGDSFRTLTAGATTAGAMPVCRFYGSVSPGPNSHFYTLDPAECQGLKDLQAVQPATQPRWNYEGIAFANYVPSASGCPGGTIPVYRYYNNGFPVKDSNHRFVTDASVLPFMLSQGWSLEGVGMCAPAE
jgi:hypothetical protein